MDLDDFLGPKPIVIDLLAKDRWEAIDELLGALVAHDKIKSEHRNAIQAAVEQRERGMSSQLVSDSEYRTLPLIWFPM